MMYKEQVLQLDDDHFQYKLDSVKNEMDNSLRMPDSGLLGKNGLAITTKTFNSNSNSSPKESPLTMASMISGAKPG